MAFGFGHLHLSTIEFWQLTPRELAAAMEGVFGVSETPLSRDGLANLMARFPDRLNFSDLD